MYYSVLQCTTMYYNVLQRTTTYYNVLQCIIQRTSTYYYVLLRTTTYYMMYYNETLQRITIRSGAKNSFAFKDVIKGS